LAILYTHREQVKAAIANSVGAGGEAVTVCSVPLCRTPFLPYIYNKCFIRAESACFSLYIMLLCIGENLQI